MKEIKTFCGENPLEIVLDYIKYWEYTVISFIIGNVLQKQSAVTR